MRLAFFVEIISHLRQLFDDRLVFRDFAIKNPQRVGFRAPLAIYTYLVHNIFERRAQCFIKSSPVVSTAYGIELQRPAFDAKPVQQCGEHLQHVSINRRRLAPCRRRTNHLCANLVELAVAAFLRALTAELWANVIEALQSWPLPKLVLDVGANYSRGVLR